MEFTSPLVAIRSLSSTHHAEHIEPKILNVTWILGKRCNYDCSYCPTAVHDWISPHLSLDVIKNFVRRLDEHCASVGKTFKIDLSGGEPFVHPEILEILQTIRQSPNCSPLLCAITNGSMPLDLYRQGLEWASHLTISLHLERNHDEILDILEKIKQINQIPDKWINVQLMCLPGKFDFIQNYLEPFFVENKIKYTLRKIRPLPEVTIDDRNQEIVAQVEGKQRRELIKTEFPMEFKSDYKKVGKKLIDDQLGSMYDDGNYYSEQELDYLEKNQPRVFWENIGVWTDDLQYSTTNSDILTSKRLNSFRGWNCFAGVDTLEIEIDGRVYRGSCGNGGEIGSLFGEINFPSEHTVCEKNWCLCLEDLTTRKSLPQYMHLIKTKTGPA